MFSDVIYNAALRGITGEDFEALDGRELARLRDDLFDGLLEQFPGRDAADVAAAMDDALTVLDFPWDRWTT